MFLVPAEILGNKIVLAFIFNYSLHLCRKANKAETHNIIKLFLNMK